MKHSANQPRRRGRLAALIVGAVIVIAGSTFGGLAASAGPADPTYQVATVGAHGCIARDGSSRLLNGSIYLNTSAHPIEKCPNGWSPIVWDKYPTPAPAPAVTSIDAPGTTLPHIGGSWSSGHVALGSKQLAAGTYLVAVTGDFYKADHTDATPVLQIQVNGLPQQITAYTGAFPANAAEGVGLGSDGSPNGLEQTASAYATVVVPAGGATAEVDAFGYNPDRSGNGAGAFGVITHATFTKVG